MLDLILFLVWFGIFLVKKDQTMTFLSKPDTLRLGEESFALVKGKCIPSDFRLFA